MRFRLISNSYASECYRPEADIENNKPMPQNLDSLLIQVHDEKSLRTFLDALAADFAEEHELEEGSPSSPYGAGALGWEHCTIDGFLGAAAVVRVDAALEAFGGDVGNPWLRCAAMLYGAKHYE